MKKVSWVLIGLLAVVFAMLAVEAAQAGGWAVVTLEAWPEKVAAERPFTIDFAVRQHGNHLTAGLSPTVTAVHAKTNERVTVEAIETDGTGVYATILTLPAPGQWRWSIETFGATYVMPPLAATIPGAPAPETAVALPGIAGALALVVAGGTAVIWMRQRRRVWLAGSAAALLIGLAALGWQGQQPQALVAEETETAVATAEMGEVLFVAKGCVQCHQNGNVTLENTHFSSFGPDLTDYNAGAEFLRLWLADPEGVKPETQMPDLELSEAEIEALVAFLRVDKE